MASRCQLRPTDLADLPALVALERAAFSDPWTASQLAQALDDESAVALVLEDGPGEVVGSVLARVVADEAEVLTIAVAPSHRRRGLGRRLLDAAIAAAADRGAATVWLEVRASNRAARGMYESAGFVAAGLRRGYYRRPPEDAVVLCHRVVPLASAGTPVR
ncbi:MAG: ribosomal protein S18-alanine N-acetyltransferase [Gemmatimonadales bacterium]|jgi:ribosomal-protein-alanine N-acetyltransferase|nr:ribosomal protein S18-alanine N-acetyltransferase [Gemmatimonadales bacterium]MDZ4389831.1 ribosomal protein S18-alanine N-acetyltransferase [Gemmatimonadales bacterium]